MTKQELRDHLSKGGVLIQDENTAPAEIRAIDELAAEGDAFISQWRDGSRSIKGRLEPL
jgi:hypothetical protein